MRAVTMLLALSLCLPAQAEVDPSPAALPPASPATSASKPEISASLMWFQRNRARYRIDQGRFASNLRHRTVQAQVDLSTPYFLGDALGVEAGLFGSVDLANGAGAPDHELNFFPWHNPWSADWSKRDAANGVSLYRAHLKLRHVTADGARWRGQFGYFQPQGPGVLGVNWSLMPGTYSGAELGVERGPMTLAAAYVTRYKAPWYRRTYVFMDDEKQDSGPLWSLGARLALAPGMTSEIAWGEAPGYLTAAHLKLKAERGAHTASYQFYAMGDHDDSGSANDHYDGRWGFQHYLAYAGRFAPYTLKAEFTYSHAPSSGPQHRGYFVYRLSGWYGGAQGAYEPWWDNRSDWDHHREKAVFFSLSRQLDDLGLPGVNAGVSIAHGWGGKAYGVTEPLKENAWSLDLSWQLPASLYKGGSLRLHYTRYDNRTRQPSWVGFRNLFQDERDFKLWLVLPFGHQP